MRPHRRHNPHIADGPAGGGSKEYVVDNESYELAKEVRDLLPSLFVKRKRRYREPGGNQSVYRPDPKDFME